MKGWFRFLQSVSWPKSSVTVLRESEACLQSIDITLKCYRESINEAPLRKRRAIIEHCFATERCFQNPACRLDTKEGKKMQPEAHKSQRSIPEERDLLCEAAVSCFARSWSVKYTKGQIQTIVGYSSVKFIMGVQRLSHAAVQYRILFKECLCVLLLYFPFWQYPRCVISETNTYVEDIYK